jgi:hypothetical protein
VCVERESDPYAVKERRNKYSDDGAGDDDDKCRRVSLLDYENEGKRQFKRESETNNIQHAIAWACSTNGGEEEACRILVGKTEVKRPLVNGKRDFNPIEMGG